ncbi:MAG: 3'-5' exonuclease [Spirochaetes bacterium]|nr:3'-5' exonuclease [Spirochaetota bacterium]
MNTPRLFAIDLETTGLYPEKGDRIIEIGAVPVQNGRVLMEERFETFVDPLVPIPLHITRITGITDDMVIGAPPLIDALVRFLSFIEDCPLVAHNAPFDIGFLDHSLGTLDMAPIRNEVIDTLELSRMVWGPDARHSLDALLARLGIRYDRGKRHRSITDAYLTARAYLLLQTLC